MLADIYSEHQSSFSACNIEITHRCKLQCPFCQRTKAAHSKSSLVRKRIAKSYDMPLDDYRKVLEFYQRMNYCGQISDPIYHPKFLDILEINLEYPEKLYDIHTTATGKKIEWWEKAFSMTNNGQTVWTIGLDGVDEKTRYHRVGQNFDETWKVMQLGKEMGAIIMWQFIVFSYNENDIVSAYRMARENDFSLMVMKSNRYQKERMDEMSRDFPVYALEPSKKYVVRGAEPERKFFLQEDYLKWKEKIRQLRSKKP